MYVGTHAHKQVRVRIRDDQPIRLLIQERLEHAIIVAAEVRRSVVGHHDVLGLLVITTFDPCPVINGQLAPGVPSFCTLK